MNVMPMFNGDEVCPKCEWPNVSTRYCEYPVPSQAVCWEQRVELGTIFDGIHGHTQYGREHLHRRCGRCGYEWLEEVLPPPDDLRVALGEVQRTMLRLLDVMDALDEIRGGTDADGA